MTPAAPPFGATPEGGGVRFRVWAPGQERLEVVLEGGAAAGAHALAREEGGTHAGLVAGAGAGDPYRLRLPDGTLVPDPASRDQPEGVHGPSRVVDPARFAWSDAGWGGISREGLVIYELHVGTFTPEGSFEAAARRLPALAGLGVTAVEVMPIAAFPGQRNWGYDGVALFAPHAGYGGPEGFQRFVDAAHAAGLGVILDVVYNHLGPEGNYLPLLTGGAYFTDRHHTPWGDAVDYARPEVRAFVLQNAAQWVADYHVDGLRLDATHAIVDERSPHILTELAARARAAAGGRGVVIIAEDERNQARLTLPAEEGGLGLDGVWADDLHHQLRRRLAGDREGYFADYTGSAEDIARTLRGGWFYRGQRSEVHGAPRGTDPEGVPPAAFVHCVQNHDQVGNRALGQRLHHQVEPAAYRAAVALLLLSPYTPLLWMGQEWGASSPFLYFTDHPDELGRLVTEGRRAEFGGFAAFRDPGQRENIPDPQDADTFRRSVLDWGERERSPHRELLALHTELLRLRRAHPVLRRGHRDGYEVEAQGELVRMLRRDAEGRALLIVAALGSGGRPRLPPGEWGRLLSTEEERFGGDGAGGDALLTHEVVVLERSEVG